MRPHAVRSVLRRRLSAHHATRCARSLLCALSLQTFIGHLPFRAQLGEYVTSTDELVAECRGCCSQEAAGAAGVYASATLDICR